MKSKSKKMILLVEDNTDDIELTLRAFRKINIPCEVVVAKDGVEALELLTSSAALPHIILLDLKLPRLDGLEVLKRLRANPRTRVIPVVMLTSSTEQVDLMESYLNGANSYIRKPVDFTEFLNALQQLGVYWLALNEAPDHE
jgi:two-component system, response regulator